jgi:hypothetical protein
VELEKADQQRNTVLAVFALPWFVMGTMFHLFALVPVYVAIPLIVALFSAMQYVSHEPTLTPPTPAGGLDSPPLACQNQGRPDLMHRPSSKSS